MSARDLDCSNQTWCAISRLTIALTVELAIWFVITVPEIYASGRAVMPAGAFHAYRATPFPAT
ncbi:MAG: hypothetical protein ACRC4H_12700, partial [Plesiomonas sp.]